MRMPTREEADMVIRTKVPERVMFNPRNLEDRR